MDTPHNLADWSAQLRGRGFEVLPHSHIAPVSLWLREPGGRLLHLGARGTTVALRAYAATDLTGLEVRSECDCAEHRTAGAALRVTLRPEARPTAEVVYDGRHEAGWSAYEAGLLSVAEAAVLFDRLRPELTGRLAAAA